MKFPIKRRSIWLMSLFFLFCIAFNADWKANSTLWWGSLGLSLATFSYINSFRLPKQLTIYDKWWLAFVLVSFISILYAYNKSTVFESIKTMVVMFIATYMIGKECETEEKVQEVLFVLLLALLTVVIYIYLRVDLYLFVLTRVGKADTGRWNANDVGILTSVGILIALEMYKRRNLWMRLLLLTSIAAFLYLDIITSSRKAILILLIGFCGMRVLNNPQKRIRNILVVTISLSIVAYCIIEIPVFYELIGWRFDGLLAQLMGNTSSTDSSTFFRSMMINSAMNTFLQNPITGVGLDNFRYYNTVRITYAHNNFAEIAADLGIVGFLAYYWIYVYVIIDYFRKKHNTHNTTMDFLFAMVIVYLLNHFSLVAIVDLLQNCFLCMYLAYSQSLKRSSEYAVTV